MKTKMLPKISIIAFRSGFVMIQDPYASHRWHGVSTKGYRSWSHFLQTQIDEGKVGKK